LFLFSIVGWLAKEVLSSLLRLGITFGLLAALVWWFTQE
jgi:hypothetical protein